MMGYAHLGPDDIVDWRGMVHPDDLSRVQDAMFKHVSGRAAAVRERASHAPLQRRIPLGDQPRQGPHRQGRAGCSA